MPIPAEDGVTTTSASPWAGMTNWKHVGSTPPPLDPESIRLHKIKESDPSFPTSLRLDNPNLLFPSLYVSRESPKFRKANYTQSIIEAHLRPQTANRYPKYELEGAEEEREGGKGTYLEADSQYWYGQRKTNLGPEEDLPENYETNWPPYDGWTPGPPMLVPTKNASCNNIYTGQTSNAVHFNTYVGRTYLLKELDYAQEEITNDTNAQVEVWWQRSIEDGEPFTDNPKLITPNEKQSRTFYIYSWSSMVYEVCVRYPLKTDAAEQKWERDGKLQQTHGAFHLKATEREQPSIILWYPQAATAQKCLRRFGTNSDVFSISVTDIIGTDMFDEAPEELMLTHVEKELGYGHTFEDPFWGNSVPKNVGDWQEPKYDLNFLPRREPPRLLAWPVAEAHGDRIEYFISGVVAGVLGTLCGKVILMVRQRFHRDCRHVPLECHSF